MEVTVIRIVIGALASDIRYQRIDKGVGGLGNKSTNGDYPNNHIKISQYTEKSPGDLRGFAVTQTRVRNYQLMVL